MLTGCRAGTRLALRVFVQGAKTMLSKRKLSQTLILLAGLSLFFAGCGDEGQYSRWDTLQPSSLSGFRVLFSDPNYEEELVPLNSNIVVRFNEQIDPTSIAGAVTVQERTATGIRDITDEGTISAQYSNMEIVWEPGLDFSFVYGALYQMKLSASIQSASGRTLVATTYVPFYTGLASDVTSVYSLPGAPQIVDMDLQFFSDAAGNPIIGVNILFNEDIQDIGSVYYRLFATNTGWDFLDQFSVASEGNMAIERNPYSSDNRSFIAYTYLPYGFSFGWLSSIEVKVFDAIDLQSQHMGPHSEELNFWD